MKIPQGLADLLQVCFEIAASAAALLPAGIVVAAGKAQYRLAAVESAALLLLAAIFFAVVKVAGRNRTIDKICTLFLPGYIAISSLLAAQFAAPLIAAWHLVLVIAGKDGLSGLCSYSIASAIGWTISPLKWTSPRKKQNQ